MKTFRIALLLGFCHCTAQAAELPAAPVPENPFKVFRGQWNFLSSSTAFCAEKVPAMKRDLERARESAGEQMQRAEAIVLDETASNRKGYAPYFDQYASAWTRYAEELMVALKRQDPRKACPDLLGNWRTADADLILEDWRGFVERSGPMPQGDTTDKAPHGV